MDKIEQKRVDEVEIMEGEANQVRNGLQTREGAPFSQERDPELLSLLQRLQADFDNYRKRSEREKQELAEFVKGNMILELLPIIDDFERLLQSDSEEQNIRQGAQLIYNNLMATFHKYGLKAFNDEGKKFDPSIHEALSVTSTNPQNDGIIVATWQKGYWLNDRLLRPAKVIVGQVQDQTRSE